MEGFRTIKSRKGRILNNKKGGYHERRKTRS